MSNGIKAYLNKPISENQYINGLILFFSFKYISYFVLGIFAWVSLYSSSFPFLAVMIIFRLILTLLCILIARKRLMAIGSESAYAWFLLINLIPWVSVIASVFLIYLAFAKQKGAAGGATVPALIPAPAPTSKETKVS